MSGPIHAMEKTLNKSTKTDRVRAMSCAPSMSTLPFIVVIPARLASARLPNKPLADIHGLPMIVRVAQRARASGAMRVLIATDAQCVCDAAHAYGFDALLTRSDHASGTDRIFEAVQYYGWSNPTIIVNVQGDEPLIDPALIRDVATFLVNRNGLSMATAVYPLVDTAEIFNPNVVKVVLDKQNNALYFSRAPIPWQRTIWPAPKNEAHTPPPCVLAPPLYQHIGVYAYRAAFLRRFVQWPPAPIETVEALEQLRALWYGERIAAWVTHHPPALSVDTPADLSRVRALFATHAHPDMA